MRYTHSMARSLESLDLNLVNVLYWVLTERSVTIAGERLGLSQPAVSRALGRLREIYDDPLVVKQGREMVPTPLGHSLLPLAGQAVEALRHVVSAGARFDPATHEGTFRIALKDALGIRVLDIWERDIRPHAPHMTLDLVSLSPAIVPDVISGHIDFVVMPFGPSVEIPDSVDLSQFVIRPMIEDRFVTCLRTDHPLAGGAPLTLEQYLSLEHILINPNGGPRSSIDDWLEERGHHRRIRYRSQDFYLAKAILRRTDCALTACHTLIGSNRDGIWICKPPMPIPNLSIQAGWHPNWTLNPRHSWVRERLMAGLTEPLIFPLAA